MAKEVGKLGEKLTVTLNLRGSSEAAIPDEAAVLRVLSSEYGLECKQTDPVVVEGVVPDELAELSMEEIALTLTEVIERRVRGTEVQGVDPVLGESHIIEAVSIEGGLRRASR